MLSASNSVTLRLQWDHVSTYISGNTRKVHPETAYSGRNSCKDAPKKAFKSFIRPSARNAKSCMTEMWPFRDAVCG